MKDGIESIVLPIGFYKKPIFLFMVKTRFFDLLLNQLFMLPIPIPNLKYPTRSLQ